MRRYVYTTALQSVQQHGWQKWARFAEPPAITRLGELLVPVQLIYGDKNLPVIREGATLLAGLIPGAVTVEMKNTGHLPNMEAPDAFNRLLLDFLKE